MTKVYIYIGIFLILSWTGMWFGIKSVYKSLEQGDDNKIARAFLPKDYMRNLEMIEKRARRLQQEEEEKKLREENGQNGENTETEADGKTDTENEQEEQI